MGIPNRPIFFHFRLQARADVLGGQLVETKGGLTICVVPNDPEGNKPEDEGVLGIAICSPVDSFSKKLGRHIALGRARCPKDLDLKIERFPLPKEGGIKDLKEDLRSLAESFMVEILEDHGREFRGFRL